MFKIKSVDGILSAFNKAISDLDDIVVRNRKCVELNQEIVAGLNADTDVLNTETNKAIAVSAKLKQLISN